MQFSGLSNPAQLTPCRDLGDLDPDSEHGCCCHFGYCLETVVTGLPSRLNNFSYTNSYSMSSSSLSCSIRFGGLLTLSWCFDCGFCHCRSKLSIILTFYLWWFKNSIGVVYSYFIRFNCTGWVWLTAVTHLCTSEVALWTASKIFVQGISQLYFHLSLSWAGLNSLNPWLPRLSDPLSIAAMLGSFSFRTCLVFRMNAWPFWITVDHAENFVLADDAHLLDWEWTRLDYLVRLGFASYVIDSQEKYWNCRHHVDWLC